jgi:fatty-acyl-CoA synthase
MLAQRLLRFFSTTKLSTIQGYTTRPLTEDTISKKLFKTSLEHSDQLAIISDFQDLKLTFGELYNISRRAAANMKDLGLKPGTKLGIYAPNYIEWIICQYACSLADLHMVNINPAYKPRELMHGLSLTEVETLIVSDNIIPARILDNVDWFMSDEKVVLSNDLSGLVEVQYPDLPFLKRIFQLPTQTKIELNNNKLSSTKSEAVSEGEYYNNFHDWIIYRNPSPKALSDIDNVIVNQNPRDITNIQFTSGTTGLPKAAALTHHNILNNAISLSEVVNFSTEDRICLNVPFYHCFGMVMGTLACLNSGATLVLPWPTFNAMKSLQAIEKWKCTMVYGVPTMFIEMIKKIKERPYNIESLYKSVIAGSICPKPLILDKEKYLGITNVHIAYGMTETSPVSFMTRVDDPIEKKTTTVGRVLDNVQVKIVSPEGEIVKLGEKGEFAVKGYLVMHGYYNDPENNARSIKEGWMMSGDIGRLDEDGFLYIEGRIKDLIIRGGENISPKEIEERLLEMEEVENAQVIGVPDEKFQEEICALIKLRKGEVLTKEDVFLYLKPNISHFKVPKYVKFVEDFPITVTGKLQKFQMVNKWVEEIGGMTEEEVKEKYVIR